MNDTSANPGFGIYVHWPFCAAKCPYCDFNSHVVRNVDQATWADALARELRHMATLVEAKPVTSIFFGGGTPSLMQGETVARVLQEVKALWPWTNDIEITLEANPTSVEAARFQAYREAGVNRLSLGVQSLDPQALAKLGRLHTVDEALEALSLARSIFPRISFDLIYGRMGQSLAAWREELTQALALEPDHLSLYQLTIEPGTPFHELHARGKLTLPGEDLATSLYEMTDELCGRAGLASYEVSNYARAGFECRHNITYWRLGDYVGVGPGAHGRLSQAGRRFATYSEPNPKKWLAAVERNGHGMTECEELEHRAQGEEMLLMGLRLSGGIDLEEFRSRSGRALDTEALCDLVTQDLIEIGERTLQATSKGRLVLNTLIAEIANRQ